MASRDNEGTASIVASATKVYSTETLRKHGPSATVQGPNPKLRLLGDQDRIFEDGPYPRPFEFNEEVAQVFDDMVTRSVPMYRDVIDTLIYWAHRFYQPGSAVYDLGCSTGTTIDVLAQTLADGATFVGIDNSRPMTHRANAKLAWAREKHNVKILCEDITKCDFNDASLVIMNYTLQFIPYSQRHRLLKRIYNGLRPGGILFISEKVRAAYPLFQETATWIYEDFKARAGYSQNEIARKKEALENVLVPLTDAELAEMFQAVGFQTSNLIVKWNNFSTFVAYKRIEDEDQKGARKGGSNASPQAAEEREKKSARASSEQNPLKALPYSALNEFFDEDPDYLYRLLSHEDVQTLNELRCKIFAEKRPRFKALEKVAAILKSLPRFPSKRLVVNESSVHIGEVEELSAEQRETFSQCLRELIPWKKGPFTLFGTEIDAEWRSDWKWERIRPHISSLEGKVVADVGCANGYFMYRMLDQQPKLVIGLDPNVKAWMEFQLLQHFACRRELQFEVLTVEHMDLLPGCFDTIFCLGVLYHCVDPIGMLRKMFTALKPGGEIIVDCQGIPGELPMALVPRKTYAKAKGIWFIPTRSCLENMLLRANFNDLECFYDEPLAVDEQRATTWAPINSLAEFLDPEDATKTAEGYPAPRRIYFRAKRR